MSHMCSSTDFKFFFWFPSNGGNIISFLTAAMLCVKEKYSALIKIGGHYKN